MIKEWIDKQKVIHELEKMFTLYYKQWRKTVVSAVNEKELSTNLETIDAIKSILYTISYILCHEFECEGKYQHCHRGYKSLIDYFYDAEFGKCLGNYRIIQEQAKELDLVKPLKGETTGKQYLEELIMDDKVDWDADIFKDRNAKDSILHITDNNDFYYWDGKNFINMC